MCGIIGYIGKRQALPIVLEGLHRMEYRGYDSAGLAIQSSKGIKNAKVLGKVDSLQSYCENKKLEGLSGIGHTRWATHGKPSKNNTHPHADCEGNFFVAHNGIIENHQEIRDRLVKLGHVFKSETDSEVTPHLLEEYFKKDKDILKALAKTLQALKGTYGIAVISKHEPDKIFAARMGAPVVVGIGEGENFIASDPAALLAHTRVVLYLNDGEIAAITSKNHEIFTLKNQKVKREAETIEWNLDLIQKSGYKYFTLKEIMEGPAVIENTLRGRLIVKDGLAKLGGLESVVSELIAAKRIIILACGTALHAGRIGEYMIEEYAGIPVEIEFASEFRYRKPVIDKGTVVLAISQSGETADTLEAIREAKRKGVLTIGIVNVVGSSITRETDAGVYNHIGPEISVISTKAFISELAVLALLTLFLGRRRSMSLTVGKKIAEELLLLPAKIEKITRDCKKIQNLAKRYKRYGNFLFIGRKYNFTTAFEGALKLKEASYVHAEGCGAGEMKHGSIAMIDKNVPTVAIALKDSVYEKMVSNIQEIKARGGKVLAIATEGDKKIKAVADDVIYIPKTLEMLSPILAIIPLQLFAYYLTLEKGHDPDRPRNLAKSVTVE